MGQQTSSQKKPEVIVGLNASLPNPVNIPEGDLYFSSDTLDLRVSVIAPNGTRTWGLVNNGATSFEPDRVLFVAQSWPAGSDPTVYFTTIATALTQAATLSPTASSPVAILIYPGTYSDPLTLVSNVALVATSFRSVVITGAMTWTPGAGVNASLAASREVVSVVFCNVLAPVSINATAKTGDFSTFDARNASFRVGSITHVGRPGLGPDDYWQSWNVVTLGAPGTFTNVNTNFFSSSTDALTFLGGSAVDIRACELYGALSISGTTSINGFIEGTELNGNVSISSGCFGEFTGSRFQPGITLTVAAGGSADVRNATITNAQYSGSTGSVDRSIWTDSVSTLGVGPATFAVSPPFPDGQYNVLFTRTVGAPGFLPRLLSTAANSFTLSEDSAASTYQVTVVRDQSSESAVVRIVPPM